METMQRMNLAMMLTAAVVAALSASPAAAGSTPIPSAVFRVGPDAAECAGLAEFGGTYAGFRDAGGVPAALETARTAYGDSVETLALMLGLIRFIFGNPGMDRAAISATVREVCDVAATVLPADADVTPSPSPHLSVSAFFRPLPFQTCWAHAGGAQSDATYRDLGGETRQAAVARRERNTGSMTLSPVLRLYVASLDAALVDLVHGRGRLQSPAAIQTSVLGSCLDARRAWGIGRQP
jgi:hypothetical protein